MAGCLAHLIRKADALAKRKQTDLRRFWEIVAAWLRQLVSFAKEPPDPKTWSDFYTFFLFTLSVWQEDKTDAGKLARQIVRKMDSMWTFLNYKGVDPTNNPAERHCASGCYGANAASVPRVERAIGGLSGFYRLRKLAT